MIMRYYRGRLEEILGNGVEGVGDDVKVKKNQDSRGKAEGLTCVRIVSRKRGGP